MNSNIEQCWTKFDNSVEQQQQQHCNGNIGHTEVLCENSKLNGGFFRHPALQVFITSTINDDALRLLKWKPNDRLKSHIENLNI